jgi:hypothetical protein
MRRGRRMHRARPEQSGGVREHLHRPADPRRDFGRRKGAFGAVYERKQRCGGARARGANVLARKDLKFGLPLIVLRSALKSFALHQTHATQQHTKIRPMQGRRFG